MHPQGQSNVLQPQVRRTHAQLSCGTTSPPYQDRHALTSTRHYLVSPCCLTPLRSYRSGFAHQLPSSQGSGSAQNFDLPWAFTSVGCPVEKFLYTKHPEELQEAKIGPFTSSADTPCDPGWIPSPALSPLPLPKSDKVDTGRVW